MSMIQFPSAKKKLCRSSLQDLDQVAKGSLVDRQLNIPFALVENKWRASCTLGKHSTAGLCLDPQANFSTFNVKRAGSSTAQICPVF